LKAGRITDIRIVDEHGANVTVKSLALAIKVGKPFDFGEEREKPSHPLPHG